MELLIRKIRSQLSEKIVPFSLSFSDIPISAPAKLYSPKLILNSTKICTFDSSFPGISKFPDSEFSLF